MFSTCGSSIRLPGRLDVHLSSIEGVGTFVQAKANH
jgi:hypothetical protein